MLLALAGLGTGTKNPRSRSRILFGECLDARCDSALRVSGGLERLAVEAAGGLALLHVILPSQLPVALGREPYDFTPPATAGSRIAAHVWPVRGQRLRQPIYRGSVPLLHTVRPLASLSSATGPLGRAAHSATARAVLAPVPRLSLPSNRLLLSRYHLPGRGVGPPIMSRYEGRRTASGPSPPLLLTGPRGRAAVTIFCDALEPAFGPSPPLSLTGDLSVTARVVDCTFAPLLRLVRLSPSGSVTHPGP